jgi:heat shock protein HspQ
MVAAEATGGEGGIRTHGELAPTPHFECGAFDLSATSPQRTRPRHRAGAGVGSAAFSEEFPPCQAVRKAPLSGHLDSGQPWPILLDVNRSHLSESSRLPGDAPPIVVARFGVGDVVRHRLFEFRGVVFDIDPVFANSEEWYEAIPEDIRPPRNQPFYHLLAENDDSTYVAYVSQQNLVGDAGAGPVEHPGIEELFEAFSDGRYRLRPRHRH